MKKSLFTKLFSGAALCTAIWASVCAAPMTANAATAAEAAELARQYGFSEDMIQQGWNEYNAHPELYPPEVIDSYIAILKASGNTIVTNVPHNPDAQVPATTTAAAPAQEPAKTEAPAAAPTEAPTEPPKKDTITLEMPDGSEIERVSKEQFINWSYEEKMTYLSTFTEEQQTVIIQNLSPEEYRSMLKQLSVDQKMDIINGVTEITNDMGLNINVDEITDDNIILSMRNQDGELVAVGAAKDTVENTGYDRRGILTIAAALVLGAMAGLFLIVRKCFEKDGIGTENE